ncbi:hypothetical protein PSM7751_01337 [Pseudooceanicola marinus]|uniref:Uncharacterized protein n=1 Tax=Pseudooceanicola marinus TaxID=396013 RepID=A0A1X6YU09_9RHOB|nr:hypothetical protein PSM7751_01337 [Pseudooceanicola marinus]
MRAAWLLPPGRVALYHWPGCRPDARSALPVTGDLSPPAPSRR